MAEDAASSAKLHRPPVVANTGNSGEETTAQGSQLGTNAVANGLQDEELLNNEEQAAAAGDFLELLTVVKGIDPTTALPHMTEQEEPISVLEEIDEVMEMVKDDPEEEANQCTEAHLQGTEHEDNHQMVVGKTAGEPATKDCPQGPFLFFIFFCFATSITQDKGGRRCPFQEFPVWACLGAFTVRLNVGTLCFFLQHCAHQPGFTESE